MNLTDIENVLLLQSCSKPAYVAFFERELQGMKNFRQFGEAACVKFGDKLKGKLVNRGVPVICLGRSRDHAADSYRFLNLATDKVINSREATWLNRACGEWKGLSLPVRPETLTLLLVEAVEEIKALAEKKGHEVEEEKEMEQEPEPESAPAQKKPKQVLPPRRTSTRATKIVEKAPTGEGALKELAGLGGDTLNSEAQTLAKRLREEVELAEFALAESSVVAPTFAMTDRFGGDTGSFTEYGFAAQDLDPSKHKGTFEVPKSYSEAWNHPDKFQRDKWREAINAEFEQMNNRGV